MGVNACKAAYDADPQACVTGENTQCLVRDGEDGACSCYIFRNTSGASTAGFADTCGYLPLQGDDDYYNATVPADRVSAKGRFVNNGGQTVNSFGSDPGDRKYGEMINLGSNTGTWTSTCEAFAADLLDKDLDPAHADSVYCYTQTGALGFGFVYNQYAAPCTDCDDGTKDDEAVAGFLEETLVGQILEGAAEGAALAAEGFTLDTGVSRDVSDEENLAGVAVDLTLLVTTAVKAGI